MGLPRLRADLADERDVARILRGALRHEVEVVPLSWPPTSAGQHLLELEIPGTQSVVLLADPVGDPTDDGQPLHVRPVTREQMATLLDLVERLDDQPERPEMTVVQPMIFSQDEIRDFGVIDSLVPSPPSSDVPDLLEDPIASLPPIIEPPSETPEHALIGRIIAGKYKIESVIGAGASAVVFRALHVDLKRPLALKILHEQNRGDQQFVKRFKAEALAASKLEHQNVARVTDFGIEPDGTMYIVMELLVGRSLEAILAAEGKLASRVIARIGVQVCNALAFAHDEGIIHRDVKPENIMLVPSKDEDGNPCDIVKVCDFGLAKLRDPDPDGEGLTIAGMLCGSPAYMSPEQTRGDTLDARSDVYSLAVAIFEALTGDLPYTANSIAELFAKKILEPPRKPSLLAPDVDPGLEEVLLRALATDRTKRQSNARELRNDLRKVLSRIEAASHAS